MSTNIRTVVGAVLVAAGVVTVASAGHAGDGRKLEPRTTSQLNATSTQVVSKSVNENAERVGKAAAVAESRAEVAGRDTVLSGVGGSQQRAVESRFRDKASALGGGPETVQELQRLKEAEEAGGLRASERAFGGREGDCGPGVRVPSGASSLNERLSGCGGEDDDGTRSGAGGGPHARDRGQGGPSGMGEPRRGGPDPRSLIGDGRSKDKPGAYIGSGRSSSAKGRSGMKDFGSGRTQQGGSSSGRIDEYGTVTTSRRDDTDGDGEPDTLTVHREYQDGSELTYEQTSDGEHSWQVDNSGHDCGADMCFSQADVDADRLADELTGSGGDGEAGGEAGQPSPVDSEGGGAGQDCLELGIRCGIAKKKTPYERMREAARESGGHHETMTPQEIFERVGQPVPTPGRNTTAADVDDGSGQAEFTPGCDSTPEGCGGPETAAGSSAAAPSGVDRGGIAGFTPTCGGGFMPCGGGGGLKESHR